MKTVTTTFSVYTFGELTEAAKEKARSQYIQSQECEFFTDNCNEYLSDTFPNSNLSVQYSLGYCQGDGLNIYGKLSIIDALNLLQYEGKARRRLEAYFNQFCEVIQCPENRRYCYSMASSIDFAEDVIHSLYGWTNIDEAAIYMLQSEVQSIMAHHAKILEEDGYSYFYPDMDFVADDFMERGTTFLADGSVYDWEGLS